MADAVPAPFSDLRPLSDLIAQAEAVETPNTGRDEGPYRLVGLSTPVEFGGVPVDAESAGEVCRVYWGSHGCHEPRGHPAEVPHACDCCECEHHPDPESGCVARAPYYGEHTRFYGEDAEALGLPR